MNGIRVLEEVHRRSPRTKVILITAFATIELAREAMTKGVFDFLAKPFKVSEIMDSIARAAHALGGQETPPAHSA